MRRRKNLVSDQAEIEAILQRALVLRVAMCHTGPKGMKMDFLAANSRVCFEVDTGVEMLAAERPCAWSVRYQSVVGFGRARLVEDPDERLEGLRLILEHYAGPGECGFPAPNLARTAVVCIQVEEMTGRRGGF